MASSGALILAAGKGTRMKSPRPKVLHEILGEPMLWYVYEALAAALPGQPVWTVVGHGADMVRTAFPDKVDDFVTQERQLGTGHALQSAWDAVLASGVETLLVVNGDTPLVSPGSLVALADAFAASKAALAFLTVDLEDPGAFGRVVRDAAGGVQAIVEAKDFNTAAHGPATGEINTGIYALRVADVAPLLDQLDNDNASGEFYITDLIGLAVQSGRTVLGVKSDNTTELLGINSPSELVQAEEIHRAAIVNGLLDSGVTVHMPALAVVGPRVRIEPGATLTGPCELYGDTVISEGAVIASHTWLNNAHIASDAAIKPFCHIEDAEVGPCCQIGPYARLRPGAVTEEDARVGNFVEMKKARLRKGAKASHLTYLGDAEVGPGANIGAGTITCNYDGVNKHKTVIGEGAFIGSNTALVAPVRVGDRALVGAGSVITKDVDDDMLAIARGKQRQLPKRK